MAQPFTPPAPVVHPRSKAIHDSAYHYTEQHSTAAPASDATITDRWRTAYEARRAQFGGFHFGAALFGWLVATGIAVLATAVLSGIGVAIAFTSLDNLSSLTASDIAPTAGTIGVAGGLLLLATVAIAYFAGGYVAGRMSRFNGAKQGLGVWIISLAIVLLVAAIGALFGAQYNILEQINLPRIPVSEGDLTQGGLITLLLTAVVTLVAATSGGKLGERYHRRIDATPIE